MANGDEITLDTTRVKPVIDGFLTRRHRRRRGATPRRDRRLLFGREPTKTQFDPSSLPPNAKLDEYRDARAAVTGQLEPRVGKQLCRKRTHSARAGSE